MRMFKEKLIAGTNRCKKNLPCLMMCFLAFLTCVAMYDSEDVTKLEASGIIWKHLKARRHMELRMQIINTDEGN